MFKKVLIAEDHESANISVQKTLKDLGITHVDYAYYCDDALLRIKNSILASDLYELLITDLSFEEDDRQQKLTGGEALVQAVKAVQPALKVLVFSAEQNPAIITDLFDQLGINGYVRKARRDAQELKTAIEAIYKNKLHYPPEFKQAIRKKNAHEFTNYDITIISQLSKGMLQKDIPTYLKSKDIRPSGQSSMEKRLNHIKEALRFNNTEQLVAYCKDLKII